MGTWLPKLPSSAPDAYWPPLEAWYLGYIHIASSDGVGYLLACGEEEGECVPCAGATCYTAAKRATTVAAANRTCCALTLIRQLYTLELPPLSNFDMQARSPLAVNMLPAALVGELSCCGRIWASCSGCLSEVRTDTLVICHCCWYSRTWGHTASVLVIS